MELKFEIQAAQKMQMSQSQIQSLEILAMDSVQLQEFMQNEYLENPMLEYAGNQDAAYGPDDISSRYEHTITYGKTYEEIIEEDDKRQKDIPSADPDQVRKLLLYQLPLQNLTEKQSYLFNYMIDSLEENGFFTVPLEEVASKTHTSLSEVTEALHILQKLEPHGIFAVDLRECLLIQLDFAGMRNTNTWNIVNNYLEEVAKGRISTISRALSLSTAQVRMCIEQIAHLNPRPMNALSPDSGKQYVIPDIFLKKEEKNWTVEFNDHWIENYRVNDYYVRLMKESHDEELTSYFRRKLDRILFLQQCIQQRRQTIQRIMQAVTDRQQSFFEGQSSPAPMTMASLAGELSMHPSTISRAIKGKYVQCSQGTISLRSLFSSAVSETTDTTVLNAAGIKEMIRQIVRQEDKKSPLSDQKILRLLNEKGISISRRAVALYRESLGIKSSYERKCNN